MNNGTEYVNKAFLRAADLKKRSTTIKRTAGSVRTELKAKGLHGLTEGECKTLENAAVLLEKIASNIANGAKKAESQESAFDNRRKIARTKIASTFGALKTIREVVPMLDIARELHWLESVADPRYLGDSISRACQGALDHISYRLAQGEEDLDTAAVNIWQRFQVDIRSKLEVKHARLIARLEAMQ